jgi:hypothetical protein
MLVDFSLDQGERENASPREIALRYLGWAWRVARAIPGAGLFGSEMPPRNACWGTPA